MEGNKIVSKPKGSFRGTAEVTDAVVSMRSGDRVITFRDDCLIILTYDRWSGREDAVFITNEKKFHALWDALKKIQDLE